MLNKQDLLLEAYKTNYPLSLKQFLYCSIAISEAVHDLHQINEIIGVLTPLNIKLTLTPLLKAQITEQMDWNPAYSAPEYDSKLNIQPSQQSDLYSLGIIMYEMLVDSHPYDRPTVEQDWPYVHRIQHPRSLTQQRADLPEIIQNIIFKLLSKYPKSRYNSAYSLLHDLRVCVSLFDASKELESFELGLVDISLKAKMDSVYIGRTAYLESLFHCYTQVATNQKSKIVVNIAGEEGTGKSTLLSRFIDSITEEVILISSSIGDLNKGNYVIINAIRSGFKSLWYQDKHKILSMKNNIERDCGKYISYIWTYFPEEAKQLGLFPQVILEQATSDKQLERVIIAVINSFSLLKTPIIIAIDDLHKADMFTQNVMSSLIHDTSITHTIIIGATVGETHSYTTNLIELCKKNSLEKEQFLLATLSNFTYEEVRAYITELVREDSRRIRLLARIAYDNSKGNIMKLQDLIEEWVANDYLVFDFECEIWKCDDIIENESYHQHDESYELYEASYYRLNDKTKFLMNIASVIGMKFSISQLKALTDDDESTLQLLLTDAEEEGLICKEDAPVYEHAQDIAYFFIHTRLQKQIYQHFEHQSSIWHYKIGSHYEFQYQKTKKIESSLNAAKHWNRAKVHLKTEEKELFLQLNAINAKHNNWFRKHKDAIIAAEASISLMNEMSKPIEQQFDYYFAAALGEHMLGHIDKSHAHLKVLMDKYDSFSSQQKIILILKQLEIYTFVDNKAAYQIGIVGLEEIGWHIPERVTPLMMLKEVIKTQLKLRRFKASKTVLSINDDEEFYVINKMITSLMIPTVMIDPVKMIYILARYIEYALDKGLAELFVGGLGVYELLLKRELKLIHRWLPSNLFPTFEKILINEGIYSHNLQLVNGLYYQIEDFSLSHTHWKKVLRRSVDNEDIVTANLAMMFLLNSYYSSIHELIALQHYLSSEVSEYVDEKNDVLLEESKAYCNALGNEILARQYSIESTLDDSQSWYVLMCNYKLEVSYLLGEYEQALVWAERGLRKVESYDLIHVYHLTLFRELASAALYDSSGDVEKQRIKLQLKKFRQTIKGWAGVWGNHSSAYLLVKAEYLRIQKKQADAKETYQAAINLAKSEGYYLLEGIAQERLFNYLLSCGEYEQATIILMDACSSYSQWGIPDKVNWLRNKYSHIQWYRSRHSHTSLELDQHHQDKDHALRANNDNSLLNQSNSIPVSDHDMWEYIGPSMHSREPYQLEVFMDLVLKQLGGTRIFLITCHSDKMAMTYIAGRAILDNNLPTLPRAVVQYVMNTKQPYLIDDALKRLILYDEYAQLHRPRSIICVTFGRLEQGNTMLLYMENGDIPSQFTERTLHLLELFITRYMYLNWLSEKEKHEPARLQVHTISNQHISKRSESLVEPLTQRELEMLTYIYEGLTNKEIAISLQISEATVKTHISNLYGKLGVKRRSQALLKARELGIKLSE